MKQLLILSGKGGTGKTTVASAFIKLSEAKAYADCDVDAPNLHLLMKRKSQPQEEIYWGMPKSSIDRETCIRCGLCMAHCRFDAIIRDDDGFTVDPFACEGCAVCQVVCPVGAVSMVPAESGMMMLYTGDEGVFSTAKLKMGSGTSGMLVSAVKKRMNEAAPDTALSIVDGSPGIGCPVISSLSGADMVLVVAEPSVSGLSDLKRIVDTAAIFGIGMAVCINKYDSHLGMTEAIEAYCGHKGLPVAGRIPFDWEAVAAVNEGQTVVDRPCASGEAVKAIYSKTMALLEGKGGNGK